MTICHQIVSVHLLLVTCPILMCYFMSYIVSTRRQPAVYAAPQPPLEFTLFLDAHSKPDLPVMHLIATSEVTVV